MAAALVGTVVAQLWWGLPASLPVLALLVGLGFIYRERRPPLPSEPKVILAPVRGRVIEVAPDRDPWLERDVMRVRIAVTWPGIVPLRGPIEGKVMELFTACGMLGGEQRPCRMHESPDCYVSWIRTDEGEDVVYAISSRWPLSRARFEQSPGERVGHGKRSGFFYFATVVDVLVPTSCQMRTEVGAQLVSGVGFLAQLPRS